MEHCKTLSAIILLVSSTCVMAAQWEEIDSGEAANSRLGLKISVDKESLIRDGDNVSIWFRFTEYGGSGQQYYSSFDCKRRMSSSEGFFLNPDGSRSRYKIDTKPGYGPIPPESPSAIVFKVACSKKWFEIWKP